MNGFIVPEYWRKVAADRLLGETLENCEEYQTFRARDWLNDMTPGFHWPTTVRLIPLEVFVIYGLFNDDYYQRYFYNETMPELSDADADHYYKTKMDNKNFYDFDTEAGRREFEQEANRFIQLYPGSICKENETLNFKKFYANHAILNGGDLQKFDANLISELKAKIAAREKQHRLEETDIDEDHPTKHKHDKSTQVGTVYPKRMQSKNTKVLMR